MSGLIGKKVIYGFEDPEHAIECTVVDIRFLKTDILIIAGGDGWRIQAPMEMFKII